MRQRIVQNLPEGAKQLLKQLDELENDIRNQLDQKPSFAVGHNPENAPKPQFGDSSPSSPSSVAPNSGPVKQGVPPGDPNPDGFSFDIDNPKYQTYKQGGSKIDYSISGTELTVDFIEGPNASSFLKTIVVAEGSNLKRIAGYTTDKLGDASEPVALRFGQQIANSLGEGWKASLEFIGNKRYLVFTR